MKSGLSVHSFASKRPLTSIESRAKVPFRFGLASVMTTYAFNGANFFTAICQGGRFGMDPAYSYDGLKGWTSKPDVKIEFPATDHFQVEMDAFSEAILNNKPFAPSGEEGLKDLLAVEAIYRSIKKGKAVKVELP